MRKCLMVIGLVALLAACQKPNDMDMEQKINELYERMPQEERVAQLRSMYMDDLFDKQGRLDTNQCRKLIPYGIGHFSQFALQKPLDPQVIRDRVAAVQEWLMKHTPNGIPALFHEEVLSGINGTDQERTLAVPLGFVKGKTATLFADGEPWSIARLNKLPKQVTCKPRGGFVLVIKK